MCSERQGDVPKDSPPVDTNLSEQSMEILEQLEQGETRQWIGRDTWGQMTGTWKTADNFVKRVGQ